MKSKLLVCLLLMLSIKTTIAQTIAIPDSNFEQALIDAGQDSDGVINGLILQSDAEAVSTLALNNKGINSLQGIQGFANVTSIVCSNNNLTSINLSSNAILQTLDCSNNNLTSIDIIDNTSLTSFIAINSHLTSLDVSNNMFLTYLSVPFNQLTSLDVSVNTALETMYVHSNNLTSLNVSNLSLLQTLYCYDNEITSLNISNATALEYLQSYGNLLTGINTSTNTNLKELRCSDNEISSLDVSNNSLLEDFRCWGNQLASLDVSNNPALTILNCSNNNLTSLNVKNANNTTLNTFSATNNSNLTCIDVDNVAYSDANWTSIDVQTSFSEDCNASAPTIAIPDDNFETALIDLGLDTNGFTGNILQSEAEALTSLNVNNKNISSLIGIEGFTNLSVLNCNNNNLTSLDVSNNLALTQLDCQFNQLASLLLGNNTVLYELLVSNNQLTALDVENNSALSWITISNNLLSDFDVSNNSVIFELSIFNNQLTSLNVKNGNNVNIDGVYATNNPNLYCIEVDDVTYSTANWTDIDPQTNFSEDCSIPFPTIAIPDANFEQALIDLGYDNNGLTGNILQIDAEAVTSLIVNNKNISSLQGIEGFINLTTLYCDSNQLTSLDISNNTLLETVSCSSNQLTSLDVSNNINLEALACDGNQLIGLDLSEINGLKTLSATSNQLTSIDISNHLNVNALNVASNQLTNLNVKNGNNSNFNFFNATDNSNLLCIEVDNITYSEANWTNIDAQTNFSEDCSIPFPTIAIPDANFEQALIDLGYDTNGLTGNMLQSEAEAVTTLNVSSSIISSLQGIEGFINLGSLNCSNNLISALNIDSNTALYSLDATANELTSLDVSNNTALNTLKVSANQLTSLDVSNNPILGHLICVNNLLETLNVKNGFNSNFFVPLNATNNPNLYCIQVDNAALSTALWTNIDAQSYFSEDCMYNAPTIAIPDANFEQALIDLGYDTNGFTGDILQSEAEAVTNLDVANKFISNAAGIESFINLTNLKIGNNHDINDLQGVENLINLEVLICNNTSITSLDVNNLTALKELHSGNNAIGSLDVLNNTLLESLSCSTCELSTIDVSNNPDLTYLELYDNQLTTLDVSNNLDLEYISFSSNQLTSIDLSNHTELIEIYAANNQLTSLNIKNGNNTSITDFEADGNPNLYCIQVDNAPYSTALWSSYIDAQTSFSEDCPTLGIEEESLLNTVSLYPNPSSEVFYIKGLQEDSQINIYDINGRVILTTIIDSNQSVNVSTLHSGIYLVNIKNNSGVAIKKLIVK